MTNQTETRERDLQEECRRVVRNEVMVCVSGMVSDLAKGYGHDLPEGLRDLAEEAFQLCTPIPDHEEAAIQAGWTGPHKDKFGATYFEDSSDGQTWACAGWQDLCEAHEIEPYEREIYEHWAISDWLADKLSAKGERTGPLGNLTVWGRPTTGQAILLDGVIREIIADMHRKDGDS